jgi:precorrin-6B methylase 2
MAERARDWERQLRQRTGVTALAERFVAEHGNTVRAGPFAGLEYPVDSISSVDAPIAKLVGAYEQELHPALDEAVRAKPPAFVDIGCADGYYAAGFARVSTPTTVFAFDVSRSARELCGELAKLNGVGDRVLIAGRATGRALQSIPLQDGVVLSDCEGAEEEIFTRSFIRRLVSVVAIIELHEAIKPGIESLLRRRFSDSHSCEMVTTRRRRPAAYPALQTLTPEDRELALAEWREPSSRWAIFRPRG